MKMRAVISAFVAGCIVGSGALFIILTNTDKVSVDRIAGDSSPELPRHDGKTQRPNVVAQPSLQGPPIDRFDPSARFYQCTVQGVFDGDTLACFEGATRVRLLLIDSPEFGQGEYYFAARDFLADLLPIMTPVTLEIDTEFSDSYGRVLAYVWLANGRMANEEIVHAGLALVYPYKGENVRHLDRITRAETAARNSKAGFWAKQRITCTPEHFRHKRCSGFYR